MFLSNLRPITLLLFFCAAILQGCGSAQSNENKGTVLSENRSRYPFSTKEPEVYQAEVFVTSNGVEDRYFVAKNGAKRRLDVFRNGELVMSEIIDGARNVVDHKRKVYFTDRSTGVDPGAADKTAMSLFRSFEYRKFDEIDRGDGLIRYRALSERDAGGEIIITIDEASGMMIRQEIAGQSAGDEFICELRNLKFSVDGQQFNLPKGYQKIDKNE